MYTNEIEQMVFENNGVLTQEQFVKIYDTSSQMVGCLFDEDKRKYPYEFWLSDKKEPIFFNIK